VSPLFFQRIRRIPDRRRKEWFLFGLCCKGSTRKGNRKRLSLKLQVVILTKFRCSRLLSTKQPHHYSRRTHNFKTLMKVVWLKQLNPAFFPARRILHWQRLLRISCWFACSPILGFALLCVERSMSKHNQCTPGVDHEALLFLPVASTQQLLIFFSWGVSSA
jgi:hypothetical protein